MQKNTTPKGNSNAFRDPREGEMAAVLRNKKLLGFDKDGVIIDNSLLRHENYRRGFEKMLLELRYGSKTLYRLGGAGASYNGGTRPILLMLAVDRWSRSRDCPYESADAALNAIMDAPGALQQFDRIIARHGIRADAETARSIYWWDKGEFFNSREALDYLRPYPNAKDSLLELYSMYKGRISIITNAHVMDTITMELGAIGFTKRQISKLHVINDAKKPSPGAITDAMIHFSVPRSGTAYVGDSVIDIITAKNAMVASVAVLSGMGTQMQLQEANPDLMVKDISRLASLLRA